MSLPKKGWLHEEAKDFRLWYSGGVYEPADADFWEFEAKGGPPVLVSPSHARPLLSLGK